MNDPIHIISLGAGVQSSTLALMAARGEVGPMPVAAVFSDTQSEPASVYTWLDWLEKQLPFPTYRVTSGSLEGMCLSTRVNRKTGVPYLRKMIPAYTLNPDGSKGLLGRDCTKDFKLNPLFKKLRELAKIKRGQKNVGVVSWIGISLDEVARMKPSPMQWAENRWPLIEKEMTRHDCLRWMEKNGYPKPPRSACTFCPFHSNHEWKRLKTEEPKEFERAVQFERQLQALHANHKGKGRVKSIPYLHNSMQSLDAIDFDSDKKQGNFAFINECEGMCGV